jgi:hypothetical protein
MAIEFVIAVTVYLMCRISYLWYKASKHRREEKLDLCFFIGRRYWNLHIPIARAFMPMFNCVSRGCVGFTFMGVQVFVYDSVGNVCVGTRINNTAWTYDIGCAGMDPSGVSLDEAAAGELVEELGLSDQTLHCQATLTPADGLSCIVRVYHLHLSGVQPVLKSTDGTYSEIVWMRPEAAKEIRDVKRDMRVLQLFI